MLKQLLLSAAALAVLSSVAAARELTDDDWAALEQVVIAHETALHAKDAAAVIDSFPPAVIPFIAKMTNTDEPAVRQQGIDAMLSSAGTASFDGYDIDFESALGPYELADGTTYVLFPTKMIDLPGDGSKLKDEVTVGLLLDEQWYLMGFDKTDETQLLTGAYPQFAEPDFLTNFTAALDTPEPDAADTGVDAPAVTLTDAQRAALDERLASFDAAMKANDMAAVMGVIPPALLEKVAAQLGVPPEDAPAAVQAAMDEALKVVTFLSFGMDVDNATVGAQADTGSPYLMIPTEVVMDLGERGGKIRAVSQTLAVLDGDTWYLIRIDDPSMSAVIKDLYPGLADVDFPPGTMEPVTE